MDCFVIATFRLQISDLDARHRYQPENASQQQADIKSDKR
jgi:hypothetical protein